MTVFVIYVLGDELYPMGITSNIDLANKEVKEITKRLQEQELDYFAYYEIRKLDLSPNSEKIYLFHEMGFDS